MATNKMVLTIHLVVFFTDGERLEFEFPFDEGEDHAAAVAAVRKALEKDKLTIEAGGDLYVIPQSSIKYVFATPAPDDLPTDSVIRHAQIVD